MIHALAPLGRVTIKALYKATLPSPLPLSRTNMKHALHDVRCEGCRGDWQLAPYYFRFRVELSPKGLQQYNVWGLFVRCFAGRVPFLTRHVLVKVDER